MKAGAHQRLELGAPGSCGPSGAVVRARRLAIDARACEAHRARMKLSIVLLTSIVLPFVACDAVAPEPAAAVEESALACSDAPELIAPGLAVMQGCTFENHVHKILTHGHAVAGSVIVDRDGNEVGQIQSACERYWLGLDVDGVPIIVDRTTGAVSSHGMVHVGLATSALDGTLPLPLELEPNSSSP